jgi:hypothetical protein
MLMYLLSPIHVAVFVEDARLKCEKTVHFTRDLAQHVLKSILKTCL